MSESRTRFPWLYLVLAYGFAWAIWIPVAWTRQGYRTSPLLVAALLAGVFGPGLAAIVLVHLRGDRVERRDFWNRALDPRRIRPIWCLVAVLLWPVLHLAAIGINGLVGGSAPAFSLLRELMTQPVALIVLPILYFVQAGLEELGWRGYMLDRLQAIWSPLPASLVLGICHAFWHLPLFWIVGTNQVEYGLGPDLWLFFAYVVAGSIYSTWCYNDNRRSVLAVILLHFTANLNLDIFAVPGPQVRIYQLLAIAGAVLVGAVWVAAAERQRRAVTPAQTPQEEPPMP
ncbi:MAG TPA: CPBP family intramembrane metalloprotease [Chloroflexi bacterium]|nr:CPBP family intramembrane metalloprotease [Chloroflexota bacterium]